MLAKVHTDEGIDPQIPTDCQSSAAGLAHKPLFKLIKAEVLTLDELHGLGFCLSDRFYLPTESIQTFARHLHQAIHVAVE